MRATEIRDRVFASNPELRRFYETSPKFKEDIDIMHAAFEEATEPFDTFVRIDYDKFAASFRDQNGATL